MRTRRCAAMRSAAVHGDRSQPLLRVCNFGSQRLGAHRCARGRRLCGRSGSATAPTRCRCGRGRTRPVLTTTGSALRLRCTRSRGDSVSPVLVQIWQGRAQSWGRWLRGRSGKARPQQPWQPSMDTVGVCWLLLVYLALARADRNLGYRSPGYCQQKRPFAPMLRSATTPML